LTYQPIEDFRSCVIAASLMPDMALIAEASKRYDAAERSLSLAPDDQREQLAEELYRLLPSDWPLWMEQCRHTGSGGLHWHQGRDEAVLIPCRGQRRAGFTGSACMRH